MTIRRLALLIVSHASFPNFEELRMLRAIVQIAVADVVCIGEFRASFHGFDVHVRRMVHYSQGHFAKVRVEVRYGEAVLDRSDVDVVLLRESGGARLHSIRANRGWLTSRDLAVRRRVR